MKPLALVVLLALLAPRTVLAESWPCRSPRAKGVPSAKRTGRQVFPYSRPKGQQGLPGDERASHE
jgi:hypothetical protein